MTDTTNILDQTRLLNFLREHTDLHDKDLELQCSKLVQEIVDDRLEAAKRQGAIEALENITRPIGDVNPAESQVGNRAYDLLFSLKNND